MTLQDAEKIVQKFGSVLSSESATDGPASCASRLPYSPERIVQAMKLWLAHDIQNRSLTQEFHNEIGTAASRLPYFIEDEEARRLNATTHGFSPAERAGLSTEDFITRAKAVGEVHEWTTSAHIAGSSLRDELSDFIAAVQKFDPADSLFWQRVYTLVGLEYSPPKKRSFLDFFHKDKRVA
jgi:hypothetical protein